MKHWAFRRRHFAALAALAALLQAPTSWAQDPAQIEIVPVVPHSLRTISVTFSPDGALMMSASWDETFKLWEVGTGRLIRTFHGDSRSVIFSPDGTHAISAGNSLRLWEVANGRLIRTFEGRGSAVAFSPDGKQVVSGGKLWEINSGRLLRSLKGELSSLVGDTFAFSPDGARVLSGSDDTTVKLWDAASGTLIRTFEGARPPPGDGPWTRSRKRPPTTTPVAFSPDGTRVLAGNWDGTLSLWETESGRLVRVLTGHTARFNSVAFSPDGSRVLSGSDDATVKLWDTATGDQLLSVNAHTRNVWSVAFSPDGTQFLSSGGDGEPTKLWDARSGQLIRTFGYAIGIWSIATSHDGARVLAGSGDNMLRLWDTSTGRLLRIFDGHSSDVSSVAFSPDGLRVLSGSFDKTLRLWEASTGKLIHIFQGHDHRVWSVAFSPDGTRVLSGGDDKALKLWDTSTGRLIHTFEPHNSRVWAVAFAPDGTRVLSTSGFDGTLKLWDANSGRLINEFKAHNERISALAFSPDGTRVLSGSLDQSVKLWELGSGKLLRTFKTNTRWGRGSVAFSPDGTLVLVGRGDTLTLWEADTGRIVRTFKDKSLGVSSVAFLPDGAQVLSGSTDTTIKFWNIATGELQATSIGQKNEWLAITPKGFFASSAGGTELLSAVRGLRVTSIEQFRDHLYRPDLVEEALRGDPEGKHKDEGSRLNLEKIFNSGPAPQLEHLEERTEQAGGSVRLAVRITDTGGGIGARVIWRVNGQTQGQVEPAALRDARSPSPGRTVTLTDTFRVDAGRDNAIEVTAYNGAALVATPPLRITVNKFGATTEESPRMHVLAVGVDKYRMPDLELRYAVKDTLKFSKALEVVGSSLFAKVESTILTNEQVSEERIAAAFDRISAEAKTGDVFVLFLAGHGKSIEGKYYYYPQTLDFRAGQSVERHGIGQSKWQGWLAKVGHVQKSVLILDTCESGAAVGLVRGGESSRQTAMDQFQHATGHNLIAAARQAAFEGYQGHGVLTYSLLEALHKKDVSGGDESVNVGSLADYVDARVPAITQQLFGQRQRPIRKLSGNDFPIGIRQSVLKHDDSLPQIPTHVLIRQERVRERPAADAPGEHELSPGADVRVVEFVGEWAIVAREGQKLGYVPAAALARRH